MLETSDKYNVFTNINNERIKLDDNIFKHKKDDPTQNGHDEKGIVTFTIK